MNKRNEASFDASESKVSPILTHDFCSDKDFVQGFYVDEFGRRHALLRAVPPYLTYTDNSPSTSVKNGDFFKQKSVDFYFQTIKLFKTNKNLLQRMYRLGQIKLKFINKDNLVLYVPPNSRGGTTFGYELARENSDSDNARLTSRNNALDKALANVDTFAYFVTFTLDKKKQHRYDFNKSYDRLSRFLQRRHVKYFLVPERHKDGAWHFHGLVSAEFEPYLRDFDPSGRLPQYIRDKLAKGEKIQYCPDYHYAFGYSIVEPCRNKEACARYMVKYVLKTFDDSNFERVSRRRYFCSTGLKSPKIISPTSVDLSLFEPVHFSELITKIRLKRVGVDYDFRQQLSFASSESPPPD